MAEKKSNGFGTFILILLTILLAGTFCFAAYLMLVPNAQLFGLQYVSNTEKHVIEKVENDSRNMFKFLDYQKIVVNANGGNGHTSVQVNYDKADGMTGSQIVLTEGTRGFTRVGSELDYNISAVKSGTTLTITVSEPEYNFLQITNQSVLALNVYQSDSVQGATIEVNTGSGSVTLGGKSTITGHALAFSTSNVAVNTTSGDIFLAEEITINGTATLKTESGKVTVNGAKSMAALNLESSTGKITTGDLTTALDLKSFNSHIKLGNVTGSVHVAMNSGILNLSDINGSLISENELLYTTVNAGKITGAVTLVNDDGNFGVNINKTLGDVAIRTGNKAVTINEVAGKCSIETTTGAINVTKADTNANEMILKTTGVGSVNLSAHKLLGNNTITTENGRVTVKFGSQADFNLVASSPSGKVHLAWLEESSNSTSANQVVGADTSANHLNITSNSGHVRLERVA